VLCAAAAHPQPPTCCHRGLGSHAAASRRSDPVLVMCFLAGRCTCHPLWSVLADVTMAQDLPLTAALLRVERALAFFIHDTPSSCCVGLLLSGHTANVDGSAAPVCPAEPADYIEPCGVVAGLHTGRHMRHGFWATLQLVSEHMYARVSKQTRMVQSRWCLVAGVQHRTRRSTSLTELLLPSADLGWWWSVMLYRVELVFVHTSTMHGPRLGNQLGKHDMHAQVQTCASGVLTS
jgi:hypothetical protein